MGQDYGLFCGFIWGCLWPMLRLLCGWFHGLIVISLVDSFRPDLGTIWGLISELSSKLSCSLCMASLWPIMASGVV